MKDRFHAELMLIASIHDVASIYSSNIAKQIFTKVCATFFLFYSRKQIYCSPFILMKEEIAGNICFEEILAQPDIPKKIILNYRGQGSDFVQLKHEHTKLMSLFQVNLFFVF